MEDKNQNCKAIELSPINQDTNTGTTPLCTAAQEVPLDIVNTLINAGADTKQSDNHEATPLRMAAEKGCIEIVEKLINA